MILALLELFLTVSHTAWLLWQCILFIAKLQKSNVYFLSGMYQEI